MSWERTMVWLVLLNVVGSLSVTHAPSSGDFAVEEVEVPFVAVAPGSTVGVNGTNATASIVGTLLSTTTDVWDLNNTNATGVSYARIELRDSTGLANLIALEVGIDNGTITPQVEVTLGSVTQTTGALVRLEPASQATIYVERTVAVLAVVSAIELDVVVADTTAEDAIVKTRASLSVT